MEVRVGSVRSLYSIRRHIDKKYEYVLNEYILNRKENDHYRINILRWFGNGERIHGPHSKEMKEN